MRGAQESPDNGDLQFRVLGPVEVVAGGETRRFTAHRQLTILGLLLLRVNHVVSAEELIDAIWDESPPSTARGQVQICVSHLRRDLQELVGDKVIVTRAGGYLCHIPEDRLDITRFERHVREADTHAADGRAQEAVDALRAALALWRGPVLPGAAGRARLLADSLHERRIDVHEHCVELELSLGRHRKVVGELVELVAEHPLREQLRGLMMVALYRSGRQAEALEVYRQTRQDLVEELGIEPSDALREIESSILSGGDHLKLAEQPAAPVEEPAVAVPQQLPANIGDFTGRGIAVDAAAAELAAPPVANAMRIVRIAGRGGIGKTTLAVHVAHRLRDQYPDGQLFACLRGDAAPHGLAADILRRFLKATGLRDADLPTGAEELADLYRSRLSGRRVLVVLDDAAAEEQLSSLLPGSPTCAVIVTSRRPLGNLPGALNLDLDVLDDRHAKDLLEQLVGAARAAAEPDSLQALVQLCGRWPLALRIIGARLAARPHWSLSFMVHRLQDEQRRLDEIAYGDLHVRSTLAVSYEGLSERARRLFRLLALCTAEEFSAWGSAALLDTDCPRAEDVLDELVEARLLDVVESPTRRYACHDLTRIFAQERLLAEDGERDRDTALTRLLGAHLALAHEAHRRLYGGDFTVLHGTGHRWWPPAADVDRELADPMGWLETEASALVAAVHQAAAAGADELCWDLALTSVTLFESRGMAHHWQETHERALEAVRLANNLRGEAALLCSLGSLRQITRGRATGGDTDTAGLERALRLFDELGDRHGQALTLRNLALSDRTAGRFDDALDRYVAAIDGFREVDDPVAEAHTLVNLAQVHLDLLRFDEADAALSRSLRLCRRTGNRRVEAQATQRLGELHLRRDRLPEAENCFRQVLDTVRRMGDRVGEVFALCGLGVTWIRQDSLVDAEKVLSRALDICGVVSAHLGEGRVLLALGWLHMARQELDSADEYLRQASDSFAQLRATLWRARALDALAEVRLRTDQRKAAEALWGEALAMLAAMSLPEADRIAERIRSHLLGPAHQVPG
ncbi:AfsR/SARP family transcriptional regulator [Actinokineospora sp. G85]|uniref:AfsR/SARP family transcriptional regulator n=1 Tax=Actinokineospora sp. G85 TaxID=3406626 RepID=UPI003C729435